MADIDQGSSLAKGFLVGLAPHFYRQRHGYSRFPAMMNGRFAQGEFWRASARSCQVVLLEFKKKLFFGKGGPGTEQFQEWIVFHLVLQRACGPSRRIGG